MNKKISKIKKEIKAKKELTKRELLFNIPTFLNALRIILTFVVVYMILSGKSIITIVIIFSIAAITDWLDGKIARKMNIANPFGAKADMLADRFLWVGTALAMIIFFGMSGVLKNCHALMLLLMMLREIIAFPFALIAFVSGNAFPNARYIAKATTFLQGIGFPALMLSLYYPSWFYLVLPVSITCAITGIISGIYYVKDTQKPREKNSP